MPDTVGTDIRAQATLSVPLREHLLAMIDANSKKTQLHLEMLDQRCERLAIRIDTLEGSIDTRFLGVVSAAALALHAHEEAVVKSDATTEKRLSALDEARQLLNEMVSSTMPRTEIVSALKSMEAIIAANTEQLNRSEGKNLGAKSSWLFLVGLITALAGSVSIFLVLTGSAG